MYPSTGHPSLVHHLWDLTKMLCTNLKPAKHVPLVLCTSGTRTCINRRGPPVLGYFLMCNTLFFFVRKAWCVHGDSPERTFCAETKTALHNPVAITSFSTAYRSSGHVCMAVRILFWHAWVRMPSACESWHTGCCAFWSSSSFSGMQM